MTKIATWNVNSVRRRLPNLLAWLKESRPDIVLLQETKVTDDQFPREEIEDLGYNLAVAGQKAYNGVAILSMPMIEVTQRVLPGDPSDTHARYLEVLIGTMRIASLYLPNGNPIGTEKFRYKLKWMERLLSHTKELLETEEVLILGGDFNICPTDDDVYDPKGFAEDAVCHQESRDRYRTLCHLGLTDAFYTLHPKQGVYSYWDYQAGSWNKNNGLRIDHLLLSPEAADRLQESGIDKGPRGKENPSDHTPVWCVLDDR
ncbi:MAG: exodeoxyribonuclease III [Nitrospiraceae bacterium]|nr:exodeoxyribonuclease III [Nitrospiraceae bacterium]